MTKRKGRPSTDTLPPARDLLRAATATPAAYPDLGSLGDGTLLRARALAKQLFALGAAAGLAAAASGCEPPSCQPTRLDEVKGHGDTALTEVGSFQLKDAVHELGVGLGVTPHPISMPMAGAMVAVMPPPPPPPTDDAGVPEQAPDEAPGGS